MKTAPKIDSESSTIWMLIISFRLIISSKQFPNDLKVEALMNNILSLLQPQL